MESLNGLAARSRHCLINKLRVDARGNRVSNPDPIMPEEVANLSRKELAKFSNVGRKTLADIDAWLTAKGMAFRP